MAATLPLSSARVMFSSRVTATLPSEAATRRFLAVDAREEGAMTAHDDIASAIVASTAGSHLHRDRRGDFSAAVAASSPTEGEQTGLALSSFSTGSVDPAPIQVPLPQLPRDDRAALLRRFRLDDAVSRLSKPGTPPPMTRARARWLLSERSGSIDAYHCMLEASPTWADATAIVGRMVRDGVPPDAVTFSTYARRLLVLAAFRPSAVVSRGGALMQSWHEAAAVSVAVGENGAAMESEFRADDVDSVANDVAPSFRRDFTVPHGPAQNGTVTLLNAPLIVRRLLRAHDRLGLRPRVTTLEDLTLLPLSWFDALSLASEADDRMRHGGYGGATPAMWINTMRNLLLLSHVPTPLHGAHVVHAATANADAWQLAMACFGNVRAAAVTAPPPAAGGAGDGQPPVRLEIDTELMTCDAVTLALWALSDTARITKVDAAYSGRVTSAFEIAAGSPDAWQTVWAATLAVLRDAVAAHNSDRNWLVGARGLRLLEAATWQLNKLGAWDAALAAFAQHDLEKTPSRRMLIATPDAVAGAMCAALQAPGEDGTDAHIATFDGRRDEYLGEVRASTAAMMRQQGAWNHRRRERRTGTAKRDVDGREHALATLLRRVDYLIKLYRRGLQYEWRQLSGEACVALASALRAYGEVPAVLQRFVPLLRGLSDPAAARGLTLLHAQALGSLLRVFVAHNAVLPRNEVWVMASTAFAVAESLTVHMRVTEALQYAAGLVDHRKSVDDFQAWLDRTYRGSRLLGGDEEPLPLLLEGGAAASLQGEAPLTALSTDVAMNGLFVYARHFCLRADWLSCLGCARRLETLHPSRRHFRPEAAWGLVVQACCRGGAWHIAATLAADVTSPDPTRRAPWSREAAARPFDASRLAHSLLRSLVGKRTYDAWETSLRAFAFAPPLSPAQRTRYHAYLTKGSGFSPEAASVLLNHRWRVREHLIAERAKEFQRTPSTEESV